MSLLFSCSVKSCNCCCCASFFCRTPCLSRCENQKHRLPGGLGRAPSRHVPGVLRALLFRPQTQSKKLILTAWPSPCLVSSAKLKTSLLPTRPHCTTRRSWFQRRLAAVHRGASWSEESRGRASSRCTRQAPPVPRHGGARGRCSTSAPTERAKTRSRGLHGHQQLFAVATLCHTQGVVHVAQDFGHPRAEETAGLQQRHKGLLRVVKQKGRHQFQKAAPVYRHGERSGGSTNFFSGCRARKSVVRPVTRAANPPSQVGKTTVSNFQNKGFPTKAVRKDNHNTVHMGPPPRVVHAVSKPGQRHVQKAKYGGVSGFLGQRVAKNNKGRTQEKLNETTFCLPSSCKHFSKKIWRRRRVTTCGKIPQKLTARKRKQENVYTRHLFTPANVLQHIV